jgi:hypothetical protein
MGWIVLAISILVPVLLVWHLDYKCKQLPPRKSRRPINSFSDDNCWPLPADGSFQG